MPVNLLTNERKGVVERKGVNLLPELTGVYKDSSGEVDLPETSRREPFIRDLSNSVLAGFSGLWANTSRIPAAVYDLAAIPQNFLMKAIGKEELQVKSPEWLMDNPIAELYDYQRELFRKEITPTKSFEEAFKTEDFDGIGRHIAIMVAENMPQQIGLILSYMAGYPNVGLAGMGLLAGANTLKEGRKEKKDPAMNAYNALAHGVIEAGFEQIGTMGILRKWSKTLAKSFGTKNARLIMGDIFKTIFHSMLGEGNEEFWTSLAQDFSSFATGINKDAMKGSLVRAFEASVVGAVSGGLLTGPGAIRIGYASASLNKMKEDVNKVKETLEIEKKAIPPEKPPKVAEIEPVAHPIEEIVPPVEIDKGMPFTRAELEKLKISPALRFALEKIGPEEILTPENVPPELIGAEREFVFDPNSTKNEGRWRLFPPKLLTNIFRRKTDTEGVGVLVGRDIKGKEVVQAIRFNKNIFTEEQARAWWEINKSKFKFFTGDVQQAIDSELRVVIAPAIPKIEIPTTIKALETKLETLKTEEEKYAMLTEAKKAGKAVLGEEMMAEIDRRLAELAPPIVKKKRAALLREKIQSVQRGIREGKIIAREEVRTAQSEIISMLEAADKAKFIKAIKNVQTQEQLRKALPEIRDRIVRLEIAEEKRTAIKKIKRELKATKPLKVGQKRVGKFDYDTNKMFDTLRDYNKLTQEKAETEFNKFPEEVDNEIDLIKKRFLSLKANGASASAEIHNQVLADIIRIKRLGKQAKDEATLVKLLNRQERIDSALADIGRMRADKKTLKTKIGNVYRRGFSNIYSMLNSIAGKKFAETYDPELSENRRNTATYRETLKMTRNASEIYDERNIMRLFETMSKMDYQITDTIDRLTTELSKLELIDIYNSLKNDKKRQDYYWTFGEDQVETLMRKLTPQDEAFGDSMQEAVQEYREILNKRNIEITGRDLGFVENYWPATSEYVVSVIDDLRIQGETPSALKERAKTKVIPVPKNAWYKAQRHISQAEHVDNLSRKYETLKRMFTHRKVKHVITQKFGEDVYNTLMAQIDNISLNKQSERIDAISHAFQKAINNWVTAKIALNPSTYVRQLMSVGNYAELMNPIEWTAGFFKGISHPKVTFDYMWKNAPFLEARFNRGYSEALKEAIKGAESISVNRKIWTKMLTSLVRSGDVTAIIYGGYPLVQSELAKDKSMKEAIDTFERATLKAQQSGLSTSISQFQNSRNPFTRLFLAFKNTVNQYLRKMGDATISYYNKDISTAQYAKTMAIYAIIQPIMYVSAGYITKLAFSSLGRLIGIRGDEEDYEELLEKFLNDVMVQLVVSPVNAVPLVNDAMRVAMRKLTGQKVYQVFSLPWIEDLERGMKAMMKETVTGGDYLKIASSILEPATGAPVGVGIRLYEMFTGKKIGKPKEARPKIGR